MSLSAFISCSPHDAGPGPSHPLDLELIRLVRLASQGAPGLCLSLPVPHPQPWDYRQQPLLQLLGIRDLGSGPYAYRTDTLPGSIPLTPSEPSFFWGHHPHVYGEAPVVSCSQARAPAVPVSPL